MMAEREIVIICLMHIAVTKATGYKRSKLEYTNAKIQHMLKYQKNADKPYK